jgi:hypothetical protein
LINLVEDWREMEDYASRASHVTVRAFQTEEKERRTRVRVLVGRFGYEKEFDTNDGLLTQILEYCKAGSFLNVGKTVSEEQFFK